MLLEQISPIQVSTRRTQGQLNVKVSVQTRPAAAGNSELRAWVFGTEMFESINMNMPVWAPTWLQLPPEKVVRVGA